MRRSRSYARILARDPGLAQKPWGQLTEEQKRVLSPHVSGKTVADLGAADLALSRVLVTLGARVVAVDLSLPAEAPAGVRLAPGDFLDWQETVDVAFLSWPRQDVEGIAPIFARHRVVVYLGRNAGDGRCGSLDMWQHVASREVLACVPDARNTLLIYGDKEVSRSLLEEEAMARRPRPRR